MATEQQIIELIVKHNKPELSREHGMVYQVWEDGEITLQKCGDLLWQRSLHSIWPGIEAASVPLDWFPNQTSNHAYIFTDEIGAKEVRQAILERYKGELSAEFKLGQAHAEMMENFIEGNSK